MTACGIFSAVLMLSKIDIIEASDYDGNWKDIGFSFYYSGDGGERCMKYSQKKNNTPVYVKMKSIGAHVKVVGKKCDFSEYYKCDPGDEIFIRSRAGSGSKVSIVVSPNCHTECTVSGVWSPDSINYK